MKPYRLLISVLLGLTLLVQGVAWAAPMVHPQQAETVSAEMMPCHAHMAKSQTKASCSLCGAHCNCTTACTAAPAVMAGFILLTLALFPHADLHPVLLDAQAASPHTLDTLRPPIVHPS